MLLARVVKAGTVYFGLVFAAGFLFGVLRELWVAPRLGSMTAELLEMPMMFVVIGLAARWTVTHLTVPTPRARLAVGCVALALLLVAESSLVMGLRQMSLADYLATRNPISGTVYLGMLLVFALMPLWVQRRALGAGDVPPDAV